MTRVLVLCTGNACRSQMAEGWLRHFAAGRLDIYSAGVEAHGLNARAVAVMAEAGVGIAGHTSKTVDALPAVPFDVVVTVCDHARERCPYLPGRSARVHAPFLDPARATGTEADVMATFRAVRDAIRAWAEAFVAETVGGGGGADETQARREATGA